MNQMSKPKRFIRIRLIGIVELVEALLRIVFGEKAPSLSLSVMVWEAQRNLRRYRERQNVT